MRQRLRLRRLQLIAALFLLLLAGSTVLAVFHGSTKASTPRQATSVAAIPEHGMALGSARAPATLVEFADPQCPYCAQYARQALPGLIDHWVRPGRLRPELRLLTFIGPDSKSAARLIAAAALQNRAWPARPPQRVQPGAFTYNGVAAALRSALQR